MVCLRKLMTSAPCTLSDFNGFPTACLQTTDAALGFISKTPASKKTQQMPGCAPKCVSQAPRRVSARSHDTGDRLGLGTSPVHRVDDSKCDELTQSGVEFSTRVPYRTN